MEEIRDDLRRVRLHERPRRPSPTRRHRMVGTLVEKCPCEWAAEIAREGWE
jgi:hypothetical protein